ncbi:uncharacterized protein [Haliotis asinina]|uniref:uncharacterized protein isoform X2 n=1 Tax=Haliotis asinina TaxID=109174 RepID=UPI003531A1B0
MWWTVTPRCSFPALCLILLLLTTGHSTDTSRCRPDTNCTVQETLPCVVRSTQFCPNQVKMFSRPPGQLSWPGKPRDFEVKAVEIQCDLAIVSGLYFRWKPPKDSSLHHMKGFKLTVAPLDGRWRGSSPICRLFDLRNASWSIHDVDVNFTFSLYPLPNNSQYSVTLVSLPQPEVQHQPEMGYTETVYIPPIGPGDWRSYIRTSVDENNLTVTFSLAPSHYRFTQYDVILRGISHDTSNRHTLKVEDRVKTQGRFKTVFYDVPTGRYRVEVMPVGGACQFDCSVTVKGPIVVKQRQQQSELPVDWTPRINVSVDANSNNVTVTFHAANSNKIAQYNVILSSINTANKRQHILQQDHHSIVKTTFWNVSPGTYRIGLQPVGGLCEIVCDIVWSNITFIVTPPVQSERMSSRLSGSSVSSNDVIKNVLGSVLGVFAALLLLLAFAFSVRNKGRGPFRVWKSGSNSRDSQEPLTAAKGNKDQVATQLLPLGRRKVFLLYTEDHEAHHKLVGAFALYLQTYCFCDVLHVDWCFNDLRSLGPEIWIKKCIQEAEVVLVIHSIGTANQIQAWRRGLKINTEHSVTGRLFEDALPLIFNNGSLINKCIGLRFGNGKKINNNLQAQSHIYSLMDHFKDFVYDVHKLTSHESSYDLPTDADHSETEEGRQLLQAIRNAELYEEANTQWTETIYDQTEATCLEDVTVASSGYVSQDRYDFLEPDEITELEGDGISISEKLRDINAIYLT